jgi:hypothetical protein
MAVIVLGVTVSGIGTTAVVLGLPTTVRDPGGRASWA